MTWAMVGFYLFASMSRLALEPTQPPVKWVPGVKQLGHKAYHSPPSSGEEVKNVWSHTSTPPICHGMVLN